MAKTSSFQVLHTFLINFFIIFAINPNFLFQSYFASASNDEFSITDFDFNLFHGDYTPPSPPPPSSPPHPPSLSCDDLKGIGSLETMCMVNSSLHFTDDVYIEGLGSFYILPGVMVSCPVKGCSISVNVSGEFSLGEKALIIAGTVYVNSWNASLLDGSVINVTGLAGAPPAETSGTPTGIQGAGGGHGGRGASCLIDNTKLPDDVWGGDAYSWSSLSEPWSYGSSGGTTSKEEDYGGGGGGRIRFEINSTVAVCGSLSADGGDGGHKGGGGSGGSVYIKAQRMTGSGRISASGGDGFAGGGGGRVSINVFSRHDNSKFLVHGGRSFGCPENSGAAGTYYAAVPWRLIVSNHNMSTNTDTLLLEFPNQPLWTNVYIQNHAKASVPLLWSCMQQCPVCTFKNISGSDRALCHDCPSHELPHRAIYIPVQGGVVETPCPYECISDRYHKPHCYTALKELIYTFGGPWLFGLILLGLLILLALVLSVARMKYVSADELPALVPARRGSRLDHSFPFL